MYCKLTDQNLQTHASCQWVIGEWKETSGEGPLCNSGWLHCYTHPLLAVFLNSIHAAIDNPRLFEIEVGGNTINDLGLKVGFTKMRLIKEIPLPQITAIQRIAFAILCAKEVETDENWLKWADNWLDDTDRITEFTHYNYITSRIACSIKDWVKDWNTAYYTACVIDDAASTASLISNKPLNLIELAEKAMTYN